MKKFKEKLRKRIVTSIVYAVIILGLIITNLLCYIKLSNVDDFIAGFNTGVGAGVLAVMVYFLVIYIKAYNSPKKLEELYIKETDERNIYIDSKTGGTTLSIIIACLFLAAIVSGFFNSTVFLTLFCCSIFSALFRFGMYVYYCKKY